MSNARTLIAAIGITLVTSSVVSDAQPPSTATQETPGSTGPATTTHSPGPAREAPAPIAASIDAAITVELPDAMVYAESAVQIGIVEWSLSRYADHGLELPHVTIEMRSRGGCPTHDGGQNAGSLAIRDGEPWIKVCGTARILLHELGHVWDKHNLSDEIRQRYIELRGLDSWRHDVWHLAAGEHVAETLTWALAANYLPPSRIPNNSTAELAAGYELLTGKPAPVLAIAPPVRDALDPIGDREIVDTTPIPAGDILG